MNKQERFPITIWITAKALTRLRSIHQRLLGLQVGESSRRVSQGKIVETLLLQEDARVYAEKTLLSE